MHFIGAAICGMTFFMALESRRLEVSIMRQKGIRSIHMYPSYLKVSSTVLCCFCSIPQMYAVLLVLHAVHGGV